MDESLGLKTGNDEILLNFVLLWESVSDQQKVKNNLNVTCNKCSLAFKHPTQATLKARKSGFSSAVEEKTVKEAKEQKRRKQCANGFVKGVIMFSNPGFNLFIFMLQNISA